MLRHRLDGTHVGLAAEQLVERPAEGGREGQWRTESWEAREQQEVGAAGARLRLGGIAASLQLVEDLDVETVGVVVGARSLRPRRVEAARSTQEQIGLGLARLHPGGMNLLVLVRLGNYGAFEVVGAFGGAE